MIAENEELFDNKQNAILAYNRASGVKKLVTIKGIKHYGVYNEARAQAQKEAISWFEEDLKPETSRQGAHARCLPGFQFLGHCAADWVPMGLPRMDIPSGKGR